MSGGKNIAFQVEIDEEACIPTCENYGEYYNVILPSDGVKREIISPFFEYVLKAHANYRLSEHHDASENATVHLAWLKTRIRRGFDPFDAAHTILHAISGPIRATLVVETATPGDFWKFLPSLPQSIKEITLGLCNPDVGDIPANVWASLPCLQTIRIHTSRAEDGKLGPAITFERPKSAHPRDDEPEEPSKRKRTEVIDFATSTDKSFVVHPRDEEPEEPSKRKRTEVIDFETSTAKAFVVLPDDDDDERAKTFRIMLDPEEGDEFVFRAIPHEKIPKEGAHKLLGCNFERVRVSKDMAEFFKTFAFVDENGKMRDEAKFNNNASAITGTTFRDPLFGRVVFVKK